MLKQDGNADLRQSAVGRCLVSAAERDGVVLVAVTLNAPDDWNDHLAMLEYGFARCKTAPLEFPQSNLSVKVCGGVRSNVAVRAVGKAYCFEGEKCSLELLLRPFEYAPVSEGEVLGTAVFRCGDRKVAELPLAAAESVAAAEPGGEKPDSGGVFSRIIKKIKDFFHRSEVN